MKNKNIINKKIFFLITGFDLASKVEMRSESISSGDDTDAVKKKITTPEKRVSKKNPRYCTSEDEFEKGINKTIILLF